MLLERNRSRDASVLESVLDSVPVLRFRSSNILSPREVNASQDKNDLESVFALLKKHLPEHFYQETMEKLTISSNKKSWDCLPSIAAFGTRYRRALASSVIPARYPSTWLQIQDQHDEFQSAIISRLKLAEGAALVSRHKSLLFSLSRENPGSMESFWSTVMGIAGKRIGLAIHVRAELGKSGRWADWQKDPDVARQHRTAITERAKADQLAAVFSIWDKDISKWPGFEEHEAELKQALGTTKFVSLAGTPESIAEAILKVAQSLP